VLTARDGAGLTGTASVAIYPLTVQVTLATSPSGLQLVYNGTSHTAPFTTSPVVGGKRTISAPSPQGSNTFANWSDGGAQQHDVTIGTAAATYTASFNGTSDTRPPTITAIRAIGVSGSRATISWVTDEPSDSQVEYGTSPTFGTASALDPAKVTSHSVRLTGLSPNTTYYYRVKSKDAAANLAVSGTNTLATK
jgi:hypothetical protein